MRKKTYFIDLDGVVVVNDSKCHSEQINKRVVLISGTVAVFDELERDGHTIILCTCRKECCRRELERDLRIAGLYWDVLIMGLPNGVRYLINDTKDGKETAYAVTIPRNEGISTCIRSLS